MSSLISAPVQGNMDFGIGPGDGQRFTLNVQPVISLNAESTYDWNNDQWSVPVNVSVSQLLTIKNRPFQVFAGARYYAEGPDQGPEWGLHFGVTLLF